jgi:hypothetical protein
VLGDPDPVDQQRHQVQAGQVGREQVSQGVLGRGDEPAGDRRLRGARRRLLHRCADGLESGPVAAGGQLGQHPLQGELVQQLATAERLPGRDRHLSSAVGGADSWAGDPQAAAPEGDLAGLGAMADRDPLGVVAAPWANQPVHVGVQQLTEHRDPGADREGEQPLSGSAGQFAQRDRDPLGQDQPRLSGQGRVRILRHVAVPFWSSFLAVARHLPHGRHQAGTATSSSTKPGTTSLEVTRKQRDELHGVGSTVSY